MRLIYRSKCVALSLVPVPPQTAGADIVFKNGNVYTVDSKTPRARRQSPSRKTGSSSSARMRMRRNSSARKRVWST